MLKTAARRFLKNILGLLTVIVITMAILPANVYAQNATAYSYTISVDGKWMRTQDAYLPGAILLKESELKKPEDILIHKDKIYIVDTGNHRIVISDKKGNILSVVGEEELDQPTGIFVNDAGEMIVADYGLEKVAVFSPEGKVTRWYERPNSPIFGKTTNFKPRKVVSDKRGNIYIVSEGSYDGIIQLSKDGEFLGYFGANLTGKSVVEAIQDIVFTQEQKAKLFNRIPKTFGNVTIDAMGMVYSITPSVKGNAVKKHNVSGKQTLYEAGKMVDEDNFVDITAGKYGQIYAVTETGLVYEYDSTGSLVFSFGGRAISTERNGLFTVASGISVDENDYLYILDKERGIVQVFYPTSFAEKAHQALNLFEDGKYNDSMQLWQEILRLSGVSRIAHNGIGKGYFQQGDYEKAAMHFKIAQNRADYSDSYWEIRNNWLQTNLIWVIIGIICCILLVKLFKFINDEANLFGPVSKKWNTLASKPLVADLLYLGNVIKHPIDSFYEIRKDRKGSVASASVIYLTAMLVFGVDFLFRSFIFNFRDSRNTSYMYVMLLFLVPCLLWVAGNYMVSSINEGEGRVRDVYCFTAYSFTPVILFMPLVTLATYFLTLNESFVINFATMILWTWCGIILFIGIKEIHNYDIRDVIKNIFLTLFFMFVVIIAASMVYMLWDKLLDFLNTLLKEVAYRV